MTGNNFNNNEPKLSTILNEIFNNKNQKDHSNTKNDDILSIFDVFSTKEGTDFFTIVNDNINNFAKDHAWLTCEVEMDNRESITVTIPTPVDFSKAQAFTAYLGDNKATVIKVDNDYDYDPDFSNAGNAKHIVAGFIKDNNEVLDIYDTLNSEEDVKTVGFTADTVEEVVKIFTNFIKYSPQDRPKLHITFPADITFEVLLENDLWVNGVKPTVISAGEKNILTF